jgi:hypothetical protein
MTFTRTGDVRKGLSIGKHHTVNFGFTRELFGLEHNDGINRLYVTRKFVEEFCEKERFNIKLKTPISVSWGKVRGYDEDGKPCRTYKATIKIRSVRTADQLKRYYVIGVSGDYGFHGGERIKRTEMCKTYTKQCLEQAYEHFKKLKDENKKFI